MSQAPTDGKNLLDPFGIWKAARDANLEAWSKMMISMVNSDEYSKSTGLALEQILATTQPVRDATEKSMTQTLSMLNMPSRAEVISIAERLVNVELRLDDLDAKLNTVQNALQETIKKTVHDAISTQNSHLKELASQLDALAAKSDSIKKIEASLAELNTSIRSMQASPARATQPVVAAKPEPKPEPKPQPKALSQVRIEPTAKKEQEAK